MLRRSYRGVRPCQVTLVELSGLLAFVGAIAGALVGALVGATIGYRAGLRIARRQHLRDVKFGAYKDPLRQIQEALNILDLWAQMERIELGTDDEKAFQDALATLLTIHVILKGKLDLDKLMHPPEEADLNEEDKRKKLLDVVKADVVLSFFVELVGILRKVDTSQPVLKMAGAPADVTKLVTELTEKVAKGMGRLMTPPTLEQPLAQLFVKIGDQLSRAGIRNRLEDLKQAMMDDLEATL